MDGTELLNGIALVIDDEVRLGDKENPIVKCVDDLKSKGIPHLRGWGKGDQYVNVVVRTPTKLTRKQKKLIEQLKGELE